MIGLCPAVYLVASVLAAAVPDIVTERVFGPEIPGKYKHPASVTELDNGDLYLVYYGGSGEYGADSTVYGARRKKGTSKWTEPKMITPRPREPEGNAVVWQAPDGTVWLFSIIRLGETWSTSRIVARISRNGAKTWQEPTALTTEAGTMVRSRPLLLADGDFLLPVYRETGNDPEWVGPDTTSFFLRYNVKKKRWTESSRIQSRIGNLQPAVAALSAKHLICYCRRGGDYSPRKDGRSCSLRVAGRRSDLERGDRFQISQSERGCRSPGAGQRPSPAGLQRQHERAHPPHSRSVNGP